MRNASSAPKPGIGTASNWVRTFVGKSKKILSNKPRSSLKTRIVAATGSHTSNPATR
jgi:hypothetical protein